MMVKIVISPVPIYIIMTIYSKNKIIFMTPVLKEATPCASLST